MRCSLPTFILLLAGAAIACTRGSGKSGTSGGSGGAVATGGIGEAIGSGGRSGNGGSTGVVPGIGGSEIAPAVGGAVGATSAGGAATGGAAGGSSGVGGAVIPIDAATSAGQTISGPVSSQIAWEGRTVVLIWEVSSGSPDYRYKFGEGTVVNGRFSITLPSEPPAEAINSYGVGIAFVAVLPAGVSWADGKLMTNKPLAETIEGASSRYGVIWRAPTLSLPSAAPADFWPLSFPAGYACGACTPRPDGSSFEGFAISACDEVQVTTYGTAKMCNWS